MGLAKRGMLLIGSFVALGLSAGIAGCGGTHLEKSAVFTMNDTGNEIKVSVDAKAGYDITYDNSAAFTVTDKDGQTVVDGQVVQAKQFDSLKMTIDDESFDGDVVQSTDDTLEWIYAPGTAASEHNKVVLVTDDEAVIMGSQADDADAVAAYGAITIGLDD